jgi:hypothetical protein
VALREHLRDALHAHYVHVTEQALDSVLGALGLEPARYGDGSSMSAYSDAHGHEQLYLVTGLRPPATCPEGDGGECVSCAEAAVEDQSIRDDRKADRG